MIFAKTIYISGCFYIADLLIYLILGKTVFKHFVYHIIFTTKQLNT